MVYHIYDQEIHGAKNKVFDLETSNNISDLVLFCFGYINNTCD